MCRSGFKSMFRFSKVSFPWTASKPAKIGSMAAPKNWTYLYIFSKQILKLDVAGRLNYLRSKHLLSHKTNCKPLVKEYVPLTLRKLIAPFLALAIGAILSMVYFGFEKYHPSLVFEDDDQMEEALAVIRSKLHQCNNAQSRKQILEMKFCDVIKQMRSFKLQKSVHC